MISPQWRRHWIVWLSLVSFVLLFAACGRQLEDPTLSPTLTVSPSTTHSPAPSETPAPFPSATAEPGGGQGVWENFPPPELTPVTPIPPPLSGLVVPDEVQVLLLAGLDRPSPYTGRTDAITLVIYHPRLGRASMISVPPDLFVYIPGYTMQRLTIAYAVGGPGLLADTIEYNFGLRPNAYLVINLDDFTNLVEDLGGINVSVLENVSQHCPGIPPGVVLMNGEQALCYMRLRIGDDEPARNRRQQEVLRTIFLRLVENGNLIRLPELYDNHRQAVDSNLTREQVLGAWRLALTLGDSTRIGYHYLSERELSLWEISQHPPAQVFLPNRPALMQFMQQSVDRVTTPGPMRDVVVTLEYQLTVSPTPTNTYTVTPTPTNTATPVPTFTMTPTRTPTRTLTPTPTPSRTPTVSLTPSPSPTQTNSPTPTIPADGE
jgi:polyisoprenyl-teichoic acid--peptidoglycan teichoic acid transferase